MKSSTGKHANNRRVVFTHVVYKQAASLNVMVDQICPPLSC